MESLSVFVPHCDEAIKAWEEYVNTIKNQEDDFTIRKIKLTSLASELSKYTFSLAKYQGSGIEYLMPYGQEKYGYLYLEEYQKIYSYEDGLDTSVLKGESGGLFI